jgi:hypothetical protein
LEGEFQGEGIFIGRGYFYKEIERKEEGGEGDI